MKRETFYDEPESQKIDRSDSAIEDGLRQLAETTGVPFKDLRALSLFKEAEGYEKLVQETEREIANLLEDTPYSLQNVLDAIEKIEKHAGSYS